MRRLALLLLLCACEPRPARRAPDGDGGGRALRLSAIGDSFTIGTGSPVEAAFPARLAARLRAGGRPVELQNLARNGYTTQDVLDEEIPQLAPAPDLVTLAIGANDIVGGADDERYRAQLRRILGALRARGVAPERLVVLPQPDWSLAPAAALFAEPEAIRRRIERFNAILREEATAAGARYVDLFPLMRRQARAGRFAGDGLHPAAAAYDEWAAELTAVVPAP